ncbi:Gamma-tubulin complex component 4 [Entophlyctis sp. JEL0112]|nr:Gamma-tubulin complex component 4 [Entophlyctis sp. JEL0112]
MQHEVFVHLYGINRDEPLISPPNLHASERQQYVELVEQLGPTVFRTREILSLLGACGPLRAAHPSPLARAIALQAHVYLSEYCDVLSALEEESMKSFSLARTRLRLAPYSRTLPHLLDYLESLLLSETSEDNHAPFSEHLNALYYRANSCGISELKNMWDGLLRSANIVFGRILIEWMVYAHLPADNGFFVVKSRTMAAKLAEDNEFNFIEANVPSFIPVKMAKDIHFIGKATHALRLNDSSSDDSTFQSLLESCISQFSVLVTSAEFRSLEFSIAVKSVKKIVAKVLWEVLVIQQNLLEHLQVIRSYFLLGRGDFWGSFIAEIDKLTLSASLRLSSVTEQDMTLLMLRISQSLSTEFDGPHIEELSNRLFFKRAGDSVAVSGELIGDSMRLEYLLKWPLDLVLSSDDFEKYGIFTHISQFTFS